MMKKLFVILALLLTLSLSILEAQNNNVPPMTSVEIAEITSNSVVTGTVVVRQGKFPNSAIINDRFVWEGQTVTVRDNGRVIVIPRSKQERVSKAPSLCLVKVENGVVTLEYTRDGLKAQKFRKLLKSRK